MNFKLLNIFYELGVHIGEKKNKLFSHNNYFVVGIRNNLSIIDLDSTLFTVKKACFFLKALGSRNAHLFFHYTNLYSLDKKIVSFFIYHIYQNKHSFVFNNWKYGLLSNYSMHASDIISELFPEKKVKNTNFTSLLFKLIFFTFEKQEKGIEWSKHLYSIKKFWRFFSFYSFYRNLNVLPDVSIIINSNKVITPIKESNSLKIPVVGLVDTDINSKYFTYPIFSNDNSFLIASFFFMLFINSYKAGNSISYNTL